MFIHPRKSGGTSFVSRILATIVTTFVFLLVISAASDVFAANFVVTRIDDRNLACASGSDCSLREAVAAATLSAGIADTITFAIPPSSCDGNGVCTITLAGEINLDAIGGDYTIQGTQANLLVIDAGPGNNRIFHVSGGTATISRMTLTGGQLVAAGSGGAIFADASTFTLDRANVTGNSSDVSAGGVYLNNGTNQILRSTISGNTAPSCGGIENNFGTALTISDSTISGNSASAGSGGGLCNGGPATIRSATITANSANASTANGGGIFHYNGTLDIGNSIVAGNTAGGPGDVHADTNTVTTAGYNLIGDNIDVSAVFPSGNPNSNNDIVGTTASPINPMLNPLAINGGPNRVPTHSLQLGSPAIDKGNSFGLNGDQRGLFRTIDNPNIPNAAGGNGTDIGSFEIQAPTAATVSVSGRVLTADGRGLFGAVVTIADSSGNSRQARSSSFGYYSFAELRAGETYVVSISSKRFVYEPRVVTLNDAVYDLDFVPIVSQKGEIFKSVLPY